MSDLLFPGKNQPINQLVDLFKIANLIRYQEGLLHPESSGRSLLDAFISYYHRLLSNFENELLQIVETSTEETIDYYFNEWKFQISWMNEQLTESYLVQQLEQWNEEQQKEFETKVKLKEEEFLASGKRDLYEHLQEYEETHPRTFLFGLYVPQSKTKKVHRRYLCIEIKLEHIDLHVAHEYFEFIKEQAAPGNPSRYSI